jgi:hypothetical protein
MPDAGGVGTAGMGGACVCETGGTYTVFVTLGVQEHEPSDFVQDVEAGFSPNSPPGLTAELKKTGTTVLVRATMDVTTGRGVTELAGALDTGAGSGAVEEVGADEGSLDGPGAGASLEGAGTTVEAGAEVGLGIAVVEGSG